MSAGKVPSDLRHAAHSWPVYPRMTEAHRLVRSLLRPRQRQGNARQATALKASSPMTPSCESSAKGGAGAGPPFCQVLTAAPRPLSGPTAAPVDSQMDGVERCNVVHDVHGVRRTAGVAHVAGLYGRTARWCVRVSAAWAKSSAPSWHVMQARAVGQLRIVGTGSVGARLSEGARCRRGASRLAVPVAVGAGADVHRREYLLKIGEARHAS